MNALLLAAGLGTRFRPLTETVPKPAIAFMGVPLMGYSLFYLESLGLKNLVLNTHHLPDSVREVALRLTKGRGYNVHFSHEPKILGSGGGIRQAETFLRHQSSDFVVANADEVMVFAHAKGFAPLVEFHRQSGALATLLTTEHPEAGRTLGGVWLEGDRAVAGGDTAGTAGGAAHDGVGGAVIRRLGGTHPEPGAKHFTGVYVFSDRIFSYMPSGGEFHIFKDCLHKAMAAGEKVMAFHDPSLQWFDMSSQTDYDSALKRVTHLTNPLTTHDLFDQHAANYAQNFKKIWARFAEKI
jgi:mannose-1-phosphate guanylyltransferase